MLFRTTTGVETTRLMTSKLPDPVSDSDDVPSECVDELPMVTVPWTRLHRVESSQPRTWFDEAHRVDEDEAETVALLSVQTRLPLVKLAVNTSGKVPVWNDVGCPRSAGAGPNWFVGPTGSDNGTLLFK